MSALKREFSTYKFLNKCTLTAFLYSWLEIMDEWNVFVHNSDAGGFQCVKAIVVYLNCSLDVDKVSN